MKNWDSGDRSMINSLKHTLVKSSRGSRRAFALPWARRTAAVAVLLASSYCAAAELSAGNIMVRPNGKGRIVVSGSIDNESTFGVTIMLELVPRPGNVGTVEFTPVLTPTPQRRGSVSIHPKTDRPDEVRVSRAAASDVDVAEIGDPWPDQGTFSPFDTDRTDSATLNGVISDNGTFIASPVAFQGSLSVHPIRVSPDARGIWDVTLSTSRGSSTWEGITTVLHDATIIISSKACISRSDCNDRNDCTVDSCEAGVCKHQRSNNSCVNGKPAGKRGSSRKP